MSRKLQTRPTFRPSTVLRPREALEHAAVGELEQVELVGPRGRHRSRRSWPERSRIARTGGRLAATRRMVVGVDRAAVGRRQISTKRWLKPSPGRVVGHEDAVGGRLQRRAASSPASAPSSSRRALRARFGCGRRSSLGALAREQMLFAFCSATERSSSSSSSSARGSRRLRAPPRPAPCRARARGSWRTPSRAWSTCRRRTARSRSRRSCPAASTGMYSAASSTRSRTSSGVSTRGSIGATTPTKTRWSGFRYSRMIFSTRTRSRLAGERDVKVAAPSARTGSAAARRSRRRRCGSSRGRRRGRCARRCAGAPRRRSATSARLFRSMKLCSSSPDGSIFTASRPSVKSICTLCAPLCEAAADLGLVLAQQVVDELLARIARDLLGRDTSGSAPRARSPPASPARARSAARRRGSCRRSACSGTARRQPRHAAHVAGGERDLEAVGRRVRQAVDAVGPEVVVLALLAVGDDRRAGRLELLDRVADRLVVERRRAPGRAPSTSLRPPRSG